MRLSGPLADLYNELQRLTDYGIKVLPSEHGVWILVVHGKREAHADTVNELLEDAYQRLTNSVPALPETAQVQPVVELLDIFDDRPFETDEAEIDRIWADETCRRMHQIDSGKVTTDSWDQVIAKVNQVRRTR